MSICGGIAGDRGKDPIGIYIHNDAGSQAANAEHYRNWLPTHNLSEGFAHYYVASDGILQAESDRNKAWHCGQSNGNSNYLSIEVCQSMGDLEVFKANEEKALQLAAQKCKQYGIVPSNSTIKLHQEVSATACPHRSVEIHGGTAKTKEYFIERIKALMNGADTAASETNKGGEIEMQCFYQVDGKGVVYWFDGQQIHPLGHGDERKVLNDIYKANNGKDMPVFNWKSSVPWYKRLENAVSRTK